MKTSCLNSVFTLRPRGRNLIFFSAGLVLLLSAASLPAATLTWNANSYWAYSIYWGGARPTSADDVLVNNPGGADNNLVVASPAVASDPGWTGTGYYSNMAINSATAQMITLTVYSTLLGFGDTTINTRAGAVVDGGSWAVLGGLSLTGAQSSLTVANNGSLSSNAGSIGIGASATSTVSVTSGGRWFNDANMLLGANGGNGLLNIDKGGTVELDGSLILGSGGSASAGAVQILATGGNKGVLEVYNVIKATGAGTGTGTLTFDGGVLQASRSDTNFVSGFGANDLGITSNGAFIDSNGFDVGISSGFVGQGGLAKQGSGTLTLTGSNSYEGNTVIQGGTLTVSGGGVINSPTATIAVGANAGETGALIVGSGGQVTAASIAVGTSSTGTGTVTVSGGTLNNTGTMSVGTNGTGSFNVSSGVATNGPAYFGAAAGTGNATISGGTWTNTADLLYGRGTLNISAGTVSTAGNSILGAFTGTSTATVSGGSWDTTGYLIVGYGSAASLAITGGTVTARNGLIIGYDTGGAGTVTLSNGTLSTSFILRQNGGTGTLNLNGGTLQARANNNNFISGFANGNVTLGGTVSIDTQGYAIGISNNLSGNGTLIKKGSGTLTLSGNNSYLYGTLISAGTLLVTGNSSAGSGFSVDAFGTLGGTGTVNDVVVWDKGTLTAGSDSSAGLLTITGGLEMQADSILKLQLFSTSSFDQLAVSGGFNVTDTTLRLEVNYVAQYGDSFLLFTDGTPADGVFTLDSNLGGGLSWDISRLSSDGIVTVVPEPGTLSLAVLGLGALACGIRRKNRNR